MCLFLRAVEGIDDYWKWGLTGIYGVIAVLIVVFSLTLAFKRTTNSKRWSSLAKSEAAEVVSLNRYSTA